MRRALIATALCALLCAPSAASAASRYWIRGAGFGHGVGMSQYGALGMAKVGRNYQQILAQYYRHTVVSLTAQRSIRVLLQSGRSRVTFTGATAVAGHRLNAAARYVATQNGAGVLVRTSGGKRVVRTTVPAQVTSSRGYEQLGGSALNGISSGNYRGALELRGGGGVTVVNVLGLDSYVRGVVPGEMPSSWLPEALKAQAVAARTYALMSHSGGTVFDVYPDTRSQMYTGLSGEAASTNAAVSATANQIVTYNGQPIITYFFSTSGGETESVQNVFYGAAPVPYLKGVKDPYDKGAPRHRWTFGPYTRAKIGARLGGLCHGSFKSLRVRRHGVSPRIVAADVICSRGTVHTTGSQLRSTLGAYDSWLRIVRLDSNGTRRPKALGPLLGKFLFPHAVSGRMSPAPRAGTRVTVYRRLHGRWRTAATGRTAADGGYVVRVPAAGTYRAKVTGLTGPALSVR